MAVYTLFHSSRDRVVEFRSSPTNSQYTHISCQDALLRAISYESQDALYDVAWSEVHENQIVAGSGDGSIKLWDIMLNVSLHRICPASYGRS